MSERKPPWNEFPEDLSTWELCVEEYEKMERKAKLWEDLKFILQGGEWRSPLTINQVLITMNNIEEQLKDKIPSTPFITHSTKVISVGKAQRCPVCNGTGHVDSGFYNQTSGDWSSAGGTEMCRSCNGKGFVVA